MLNDNSQQKKSHTPDDPEFITTVKNVREVSLIATAGIAYWREKLEPAGLYPHNKNGKAEIIFSVTDIRFLGKRTNEFTIGVAISRQPDGGPMDGMFLVQAFNSSRFFAWVERAMFKTPYYPGNIYMDDRIPARLVLSDARGPFIQAQMNTEVTPSRSQYELWQGTIYLPAVNERHSLVGRLFYASLAGFMVVYPYLTSGCSFVLSPLTDYPFMRWLIESEVIPLEWRVRSRAVHARSKTYTRRRN